MNRNQSYLSDIDQYAQEVIQVIEGMDESSFQKDRTAQMAVLYGITIIGEVVKKLSSDFKEKHSSVPWKKIAGTRDKLVHDYQDTDMKLVWAVTQNSIPELINYIQPLLD